MRASNSLRSCLALALLCAWAQPAAGQGTPGPDDTPDQADAETAPAEAEEEPTGESGAALVAEAPEPPPPPPTPPPPPPQATDDERPPTRTVAAPPPAEVAATEPVEGGPDEDTEHWYDRVRFGGLLNLWASTREGGAIPDGRTLPIGIRTARLSVRADPHEWVRLDTQFGLEAPTNPLLDATVTLRPPAPVRVTAGQFRIPVGATTITPYSGLVFWDRPLHVGQFLKVALRDIGLKVHAPADFPIRYQFGVFNGSGILGAGGRFAAVPRNLLYTGRLTVDAAHWLDAMDRFEFGVSYATSRMTSGFGPNFTDLGTSLGFVGGNHRVHVLSTDLSVAFLGVWFQFESWYLRSHSPSFDENAEALAFSLEAAYRFGDDDFYVQPAFRYEFFQPSRPEGLDNFRTDHLMTVGVNVRVCKPLLLGAYYIWYDPQLGDNTVHQFRVRLQAGF